MTAPLTSDFAYQDQILIGVSRTFALTIPQLPPDLKKVVGNAYLLCRIADTIEDDDRLSAEHKRYFSDRFTAAVAGRGSAEDFAASLYPKLSTQTTEAERNLISNAGRVLRITHSFSPRQRQALAHCVAVMGNGMATYQEQESLHGLRDLKAMGDYCYYVAGVVGEMLTELFCDYSDQINREHDQLTRLSVSFGQGLQMTNILKDMWEDRARGACWLPQDVFQRAGFDLSDLDPENPGAAGFKEGLGELIAVALSHLQNALSYTLLIPKAEQGIRRFCLWAIGMAVLTLRNINRHRDFSAGHQVKISRRAVKLVTASTTITAKNDRLLKFLFYISTRQLPKLDNHETMAPFTPA